MDLRDAVPAHHCDLSDHRHLVVATFLRLSRSFAALGSNLRDAFEV
jgi:hypothetical protein